jgi:hypothetical protein
MLDMTNYDDWEDLPTLIQYLAVQLASSRLALTLGAGISKPLGLPDWEELIERLYRSKAAPRPSSGDLTQQAEDFRTKFFPTDFDGFKTAVKTALYDGFAIDFKTLRQNDNLAAIASLVMSSQRGSASKVVSFNYDNLVEIYLAYHGFVARPVSDEIHWSNSPDVTIYHPHGFLPYGAREPLSEQLILDRESYDQILGKPHLPWYQLSLTIMRTHTCVFIGLSGDDNALTGLLTDIKNVHAIANSKRELFWGVLFTTNPDLKPRWEKRNVFCKVLKNYNELPDILFKVCQYAAQSLKFSP